MIDGDIFSSASDSRLRSHGVYSFNLEGEPYYHCRFREVYLNSETPKKLGIRKIFLEIGQFAYNSFPHH
jgi:hypothetical protein